MSIAKHDCFYHVTNVFFVVVVVGFSIKKLHTACVLLFISTDFTGNLLSYFEESDTGVQFTRSL